MPIALIDYGAGNLTSVRKAFAAVGADLFVPTTPAEVEDATAVVVPGVGHAPHLEAPAIVTDAVGAFVRNLSADAYDRDERR